MKSLLEDRAALITGGSQGLGFVIAREYVKAGADIMICGRQAESLIKAKEELDELATSGQRIFFQVADVSKPDDVQRLVGSALDVFPRLHVLVNNAGVYGPKGAIEKVDWQEWQKAIEINLFGSIHLCKAVLPHFKSHQYGKIIQLSGGGATNPLPCLSAYAASKAAVVRFAETLAEEVRDWNIDVNSIAPGALNTRLLDEVLEAGPEKIGADFFERSKRQKEKGGIPLEKGAELAVFLASSASDGMTGKLISAVWDPWKTFHENLEDLQKTDIYTLRRIVPKDRQMAWGES